MTYRVKITPPALERINSWGLSRALLLAVYTRLQVDLAGNPDELLGEQLVPLAARAFTFTDDRGSIPYQLHFLFAVNRLDDVGELHIIGGRMTLDDTEEN